MKKLYFECMRKMVSLDHISIMTKSGLKIAILDRFRGGNVETVMPIPIFDTATHIDKKEYNDNILIKGDFCPFIIKLNK